MGFSEGTQKNNLYFCKIYAMKKSTQNIVKAIFWVCCMATCLQAATSYAQGKKQNRKVAAARAAISMLSKKDTLQAARRSFKEATGCEVKIAATLNATYKKGSAADIISAFFRDLVNAKVKVDDAIGIEIAWKEATGAYAIGGIDVETGKAPTGLFSDDALSTFGDSVGSYRETIAKIEDTRVDTVIIAALAALQKSSADAGEPKSVIFSVSADSSKPVRVPYFDDNDKEHCSAYPTYKENEPYIYTGISANVFAHVTPPNQVEKVAVTEDAILMPGKTSPLECAILPSGNTTVVAYKKGDESRKPLGKINVIYISSQTEIKITICKVKYKTEQDYPPVNVNAIATILEKIYGVVGQTFTLSETMVEIASPDINANGMLDARERDSLKAFLPKVKDYTIFVINQRIESGKGGGEAAGYGNLNKKYPDIQDDPIMVVTQRAFVETYTHEVGHAVFGLKHPFEEFSSHKQGKDPYNIMDYGRIAGKTQLRAYQVKKIVETTPKTE